MHVVSPCVFFVLFVSSLIGTASVLFEVVPMEYSTSVKEASTIVIVAITVIIINHLARSILRLSDSKK